ncbi:MAG TPA: hypothetical protein VM451_00210 [Candidatus Limnocylindria bacterium]|nr:hypothetical protein [Candidatus Limnocylindria bacterium]
MHRPSARSAALPLLVGLVSAALLAVACQPSATPVPTSSQPAATHAGVAPSPANITFPPFPSLEPGFSVTLPSFTPDRDLEALLPEQISGQVTIKSSMTGPSFLNGPGGAGLRGVLDQFDKAPEDLSVAFANGAGVTISAYRIKGVDANEAFDAFLAVLDLGSTPVVTDASFAGRPVKKLVTGGTTAYVYLHDDILFTIGGLATVSNASIEDAVSQVP